MAGGTAPSGRPVFDSLLWVLAVWGEKVSVGGVIGFARFPCRLGLLHKIVRQPQETNYIQVSTSFLVWLHT